jgi:hypothetical protein
MGVAGRPDLLEIRLRPGDDFESIHRDEHGFTYRLGVRLRENVGPDRPV